MPPFLWHQACIQAGAKLVNTPPRHNHPPSSAPRGYSPFMQGSLDLKYLFYFSLVIFYGLVIMMPSHTLLSPRCPMSFCALPVPLL